MPERKMASWRLPVDLLDQLREDAEADHRSVNNYVELVLRRVCAERRQQTGSEPPPR